MKSFFIVFLVLIFLVGCAKIPNVVINNGQDSIRINVEIADDTEKLMRGLMFREKLEENSGMLFIFSDEDYRHFWMKNTLIPLDMLFISKDFEILDIKYAIPCKQDHCGIYGVSKTVKYVLEVNGNFTIKHNIAIGNKVILNT